MGQPGAGVGRAIASGERAEAGLDQFISRRDERRRQNEGERSPEALWRVSERRHEALRRDEMRVAWSEYHRARACSLRKALTALVAFHEAEAERLGGGRGRGDAA